MRQIGKIIAFEQEIVSAESLAGLEADGALFAQAREFGFPDKQIAVLLGAADGKVCATRDRLGLWPSYTMVDTCAAEFAAMTPCFYSSYGGALEKLLLPSEKKRIMIPDGGLNRIGQGIEFDYCCVCACMALREAGFEIVMVNSNPETVLASDRVGNKHASGIAFHGEVGPIVDTEEKKTAARDCACGASDSQQIGIVQRVPGQRLWAELCRGGDLPQRPSRSGPRFRRRDSSAPVRDPGAEAGR